MPSKCPYCGTIAMDTGPIELSSTCYHHFLSYERYKKKDYREKDLTIKYKMSTI